MRSRASGADADSVGATTSATDIARTPRLFVLLASALPTRMRAAEDNPNHPYAGLSSVHGCSAESTADWVPWPDVAGRPAPWPDVAGRPAPCSCIKPKP